MVQLEAATYIKKCVAILSILAVMVMLWGCSGNKQVLSAQQMGELEVASVDLQTADWFDEEADELVELTPLGAYRIRDLGEQFGGISLARGADLHLGKESPFLWYFVKDEKANINEIKNDNLVYEWFDFDLRQFDIDWDTEMIIFSAFRPISYLVLREEPNIFTTVGDDEQYMVLTLNAALSHQYEEDILYV